MKAYIVLSSLISLASMAIAVPAAKSLNTKWGQQFELAATAQSIAAKFDLQKRISQDAARANVILPRTIEIPGFVSDPESTAPIPIITGLENHMKNGEAIVLADSRGLPVGVAVRDKAGQIKVWRSKYPIEDAMDHVNQSSVKEAVESK